MNKNRLVFIILLVIVVIGLVGFFVIGGAGKNKLAALEVDSNLVSRVTVNGKDVGTTPYNGTFAPGEIVVSIDNYQTRVTLQTGVKTIIQRDFDSTKSKSSGQIVSFEKIGGADTSLAVVTDPDSGQIILDGIPRGIAPIKIDGITVGKHDLNIAASGFSGKSFSINIVPGYKLVAVVDLNNSVSATIQQVATAKPFIDNEVLVEILSTPTGFLRVRDQPQVASNEIGQVHPGEKYKFLTRDDKTGWFQIQLNATSSGWISNTYAATTSGSIKN